MNMQLTNQLQQHFNYKQFRPGQKEIIEQVLQGNDVLGILPTGSGKSLCYQLPSLILPDLTVVISPLISLMIDQVRETKAFHIKEVVALHSMQSYEERHVILQQLHRYKIVYISPELIQNNAIAHALEKRKISLFVIDEAHCISQWGYDFRPDYLRLQHVLDSLNNPPVLALSGTITKRIENDILEELQRPAMKVFKHRTDRENITLIVEHIESTKTKDKRLCELIHKYNVPMIIYFSSRKQAEEIAHFIATELPDKHVAYYHGGLDQESRLKIQQQFLYNQLQIICATSAFGMGINKSNVRMVVHYHLPSQKESFIQEIGRAGRDGEQSVSIVLYQDGDEYIPQQLIEHELPTEREIRSFFNYLYKLHKQTQRLPNVVESTANILDIDEIKVNFLRYQLEMRHMVRNNQIMYDYKRWTNALYEITEYCEARKRVKFANFDRLFQYISTGTCLRIELYKDFQQQIEKQVENCCSSCGYEEDMLDEDIIDENHVEEHSWRCQLAYLFGVGEKNESTKIN